MNPERWRAWVILVENRKVLVQCACQKVLCAAIAAGQIPSSTIWREGAQAYPRLRLAGAGRASKPFDRLYLLAMAAQAKAMKNRNERAGPLSNRTLQVGTRHGKWAFEYAMNDEMDVKGSK